MRILATLFGIVLLVTGVGLIFLAVIPLVQDMAVNIPEAVIGGVLFLVAIGISISVYQARQNELIDRLRR